MIRSSEHRIYIDMDAVNQVTLKDDNHIYFHFESQHELILPLRCSSYEEAEQVIYGLSDRSNLLLIEEKNMISLVNLKNVVNIGLTEGMKIKCCMRDQEHLYSTELDPEDVEFVFVTLKEKLMDLIELEEI